jgi:ribosomal protein L40E
MFMVFIVWIGLAFLVGALAAQRGRSGLGWGLLGFFLDPIIPLIILLILPDLKQQQTDQFAAQMALADTKVCLRCAERVKAAASVCRYCGFDFQTGQAPAPAAPLPPNTAAIPPSVNEQGQTGQ